MARLTVLIYLQTFGNAFADTGVQCLRTLTQLHSLHLEEETLTLAAFDFVQQLPHLKRLGTQDVQLSRRDLRRLQSRLSGVDVG